MLAGVDNRTIQDFGGNDIQMLVCGAQLSQKHKALAG
jgi:hypothetical protein